jgi:hypothetical protein
MQMAKRLIALCLLLIYIGLMGYGFLPYLLFKANQDYIAKELCVNKDVAGSTCKGSCHLKIMLDQQADAEKHSPHAQVQFEQGPLHTETAGTLVPALYPPVTYVGYIVWDAHVHHSVVAELQTPPPRV